ncbi:MAG TPA: MFS transporter [Candidatus Baltobacteraceae bacterium]|nr:MFS transporter [Candidatus Baltobacteraceae bacterium]
MPLNTTRAKPGLLGLFWFGIQMVWGALLGVSLQARASQLVPANAVSAYGELAMAGAAAAAVTQIAAGIISDRRRTCGSRRIEFYLSGAIAAAAAIFWFYSAHRFGELLAAFIALEIAMNVAIGPYQAAIPDSVPLAQFGTASSWMAALQSAGNAAGAVLAGLVARSEIVALTLSTVLVVSCAATSRHVQHLALAAVGTDRVRITRPFVDLFISRALAYVGFYTVLGYLYFYVAAGPYSNAKTVTALLLLVFTLCGTAGAAACGLSAAKMDRRLLASIGGGFFIAALCSFLLASAAAAVAASAALAGAAWGAFLTADWALGCGLLPRRALATAMGVWNLALILPQILAPALATAVLRACGALHSPAAGRMAFGLAAVEVFAGILWIWRLPASPISVETA